MSEFIPHHLLSLSSNAIIQLNVLGMGHILSLISPFRAGCCILMIIDLIVYNI